MKWMLLVLVFRLAAGQMEAIDERYRIYSSKAACDAAGEQLQTELQYPDPNIHSLSACIPESAFNDAPADEPDKGGDPDQPPGAGGPPQLKPAALR